MPRNTLIAVALSVVLSCCTGGVALAGLFGPGPWFGYPWPYGNDTGGIIPYKPEIRGATIANWPPAIAPIGAACRK